MIAPRMGTMLGLVLTDAPLTPAAAQAALSAVIDDTFNCISIDGHMSTNDTVLLLANGAAGGPPLERADFEAFQDRSARSVRRVGPGDSGRRRRGQAFGVDRSDRLRDARSGPARLPARWPIAPLVKTAIAGADPNWGRIVSAAGYAGVPFDPAKVELHVNGFLLYQQGTPTTFDAAAVSASIRDHRDTRIELKFSEGQRADPFLDHRPDGRIRPAQCGLSHVTGC